jgi:hypothetical protein
LFLCLFFDFHLAAGVFLEIDVNFSCRILSSNKLDGNLPKELAELKNLTDL